MGLATNKQPKYSNYTVHAWYRFGSQNVGAHDIELGLGPAKVIHLAEILLYHGH